MCVIKKKIQTEYSMFRSVDVPKKKKKTTEIHHKMSSTKKYNHKNEKKNFKIIISVLVMHIYLC